MPSEKLPFLRQSHTLHPHPEGMRNPLFTSESPFFYPYSLAQFNRELLPQSDVVPLPGDQQR